jgi:hypothetical protein
VTDQTGAKSFDTLTKALAAKMHANRAVIERARFIRITLRREANGEVEVDIEPKL